MSSAARTASRTGELVFALALGLLCHALFVAAVGTMAFSLAHGLQSGRGNLAGPAALLVNGLLLLQFPLLHSLLLTRRGSSWLVRLGGRVRGARLLSTSYALVASLQLLLTFWAWSPSGVTWHSPDGWTGAVQWLLFAFAWVFLVKAIRDAGAAVQTGFVGWWAHFQDRSVNYGGMPVRGLFAICRQPIYLGFALVLWTAPCWSLDWLLIALVWSCYCVVGPLHKERRFLERYGERFVHYSTRVPYFLPRRSS
jgi:protein-S-isoprenylcysteine O-methyltransferase Ste14